MPIVLCQFLNILGSLNSESNRVIRKFQQLAAELELIPHYLRESWTACLPSLECTDLLCYTVSGVGDISFYSKQQLKSLV